MRDPASNSRVVAVFESGGDNMRIVRRDFLALSIAAAGFGRAQAAEPFWADLRSGRATALLRHALAPGVDDPEGFKLGDCSTQRNLSDAGRAQARAIGELFRANGVESASIYSSRWCRCLDTARLLGLGDVTLLPLLDSLFGQPSAGPDRSTALMAWHRNQRFDRPVVLVTHQANITILTDEGPASGETVFVRFHAESDVEVIGRVPPPA
jgi:phosphohistidine phosphatase SixA